VEMEVGDAALEIWPEFKIEAARPVRERRAPVAYAACNLDVMGTRCANGLWSPRPIPAKPALVWGR